jgi:DNA-binding protein HU-beta
MMKKPMTKAELVTQIATHGDLTKAEATTTLDTVVAVITAQLIAGETVMLPGLAKFETRDRPARQVRNVSTGAMLDKEADRAVKISAMTGIKAAVNA